MKFGYFDDEQKEYVITTPKTPLPWINYLGCNEFFSLISNTCGGYSFYKDAKLLRLTRYRYNDVPARTGIPFGIRAGSLPRRSWISTNVDTALATAALPARKMRWKLPSLPLFRWMTTVRLISLLSPTILLKQKSFLFFLMWNGAYGMPTMI